MLPDERGVVRIGEFMGFPVYVDRKLRPNEARLISFTWNPIEQRMQALSNVRITNLRSED